jgi:hypothetical protein
MGSRRERGRHPDDAPPSSPHAPPSLGRPRPSGGSDEGNRAELGRQPGFVEWDRVATSQRDEAEAGREGTGMTRLQIIDMATMQLVGIVWTEAESPIDLDELIPDDNLGGMVDSVGGRFFILPRDHPARRR